MIDLHCHILPGIDDGAPEMAVSIEMARMAASAGTRVLACTPHVRPPVYPNIRPAIETAVGDLRAALDEESIDLELVVGGDVHIAQDLLEGLRGGSVPTLAQTRYFLLEPNDKILPPNFVSFCKSLMAGGYVPILTHPERMQWIERHYDTLKTLSAMGVPMQLTGQSIIGSFGATAQKWSERMLRDGLVDIVASDGHNCSGRKPVLNGALTYITNHFGSEVANRLLLQNPRVILSDDRIETKKLENRTFSKRWRKNLYSVFGVTHKKKRSTL